MQQSLCMCLCIYMHIVSIYVYIYIYIYDALVKQVRVSLYTYIRIVNMYIVYIHIVYMYTCTERVGMFIYL